jgi:hypothetical protein
MDAPTGTSIALSLRMAKAMGLARSGKLRDAQALLAAERTIPDHPVALQALAALVTSEGDYVRALKLWELLLQRDPHHPEAKRMVQAIELWLSRPPWMRYWMLGAATLCAVAIAGFFWLLASPAAPAPAASPSSSSAPAASRSLPAGINATNPVNAPYSAPVKTETAPARVIAPSAPQPSVTFPTATPPKKRTR